MSYTAQEIFEQSIVIIDELSDTGTINDSQVNEYKYKAPRLLDMWQHEAAKNGNLYYKEEYANTDADNVYQWTKFSLPTGFKRVKDIMFVDDDSQPGTVDYKTFGKDDIYIYFTTTGTVKMLYIPIPAKITALAQTLEVDEDVAISGSYYLAEHFALADQNDALAQKCRNKYAELKAEDSTPSPITPQDIEDAYGISSIR
jgi:hypothetical protein